MRSCLTNHVTCVLAPGEPSPPLHLHLPPQAIASGRRGFNPENIEVLSLDRPRAFVFHEFLTDEECDHLVEVAKSAFHQEPLASQDCLAAC